MQTRAAGNSSRSARPRWPRPSAPTGAPLNRVEQRLTCDNMLEKTYCGIPTEHPLVLKPVEWIGSARDDLREMPEDIQGTFGYALHEAQRGKHHPNAKQLKGELHGLIEVVDDFDGDTYRAIYTVKLAGIVYVLHVFQKKSTRGIATPKREIAVIKERWQRAKRHYAAHYGA